MRRPPEWILVGMIKRIHGNAGELLVRPLTDRPERFNAGSTLYMSKKGSHERFPVTIETSRPTDKGPIVKLEGYGSRDDVWEIFSAGLFIPAAELAQLAPDEYFPFELEGLEVFEGNRLIGTVSALYESAKANPYLEIDTGNGQPLYIPFLKAVITCIDLDAGRIDILPGFTPPE